jgi:hypothetical protein
MSVMTKLCRVNDTLRCSTTYNCRELQNTSFGTWVNNGANFGRHLGSEESTECIVSDLARKNTAIVLDIQRQLYDDRLVLGETPADPRGHDKQNPEVYEGSREGVGGSPAKFAVEIGSFNGGGKRAIRE